MSNDYNVRQSIIDRVQPLLPKSWVFIPVGGMPTNISKVTVTLALKSVTRTRPLNARQLDYVLTIATPEVDPEKAPLLNDDNVFQLLDALDDAARTNETNVLWGPEATAGVVGNYYGYEIPLQTTYLDPRTT